jgi:hypothetical protein
LPKPKKINKMKKLLSVLTLGTLLVSCNNGESKSRTANNQAMATVSKVKVTIDTPQNPNAWQNTLTDYENLNVYSQAWANFAKDSITSKNPLLTTSFVMNANALYHAVTDSPNITNVIIYLAMNRNKDTLKLMYLPARPGGANSNNTTDSVTSVISKNNVFNQSVPCPSCAVYGQ